LDYSAAVAFLEGLPAKKKWSLAPTRALCKAFGVAPEKIPCVLITGTNGKGSVAAMLESILRSAGAKTGLYTSPHLVKYNERFKINGKGVSDKDFCKTVSEIKPFVQAHNKNAAARGAELLSTFEVLTVIAFKVFEEARADFCVFEVGMGGRLDSTNVLEPAVSVITNVALEHTQALGTTVEKIAEEKAGILRKGRLAVTASSGKALEAIRRGCARKKTTLSTAGALGSGAGVEYSVQNSSLSGTSLEVRGAFGSKKLETHLLGAFQAENAAVAFATAKVLQKAMPAFGIKNSAIAAGIENAEWPGRFEIISKKPLVVFDGAHNPAGAQALARSARVLLKGRKIFLVLAVMKDKEVSKVAGALAEVAAKVFATRVAIGRSATPARVARFAGKKCKNVVEFGRAWDALSAAVREARKENAVVLVAGSLYLEGELKSGLLAGNGWLKGWQSS
jgi:dihydrofolate synthase/folylpolyglutamate synthase